ncbi:MAG TPA: hypothetical protein VFB80_15525, partial [Pirellulaceae bacterium]|nr:hypothetical protein [Pirellulaceae bacterium]
MTRAAILGVVGALWLLGSASAQEATPQGTRARVPAAKALADKEKAARADVEAARQEFKDAKGAQARLEAADKMAAAVARLVEAQKQFQRAQEAALQAAIRIPSGRDVAERDVVHPDDPIERFALLTPGGPLVVEAALTIDGKPFRQAREQLIRDLIAAADKDKDGKTTWTEALASPRFTLGRINSPNEQTRTALIRNFDKNADEIVDPGEARKLIAQFFQGGTFSLGSGAGFVRVLTANGVAFGGANNQANLLELLDTDHDKALDAKELAAAAGRLKSRDADDNDLLAADEVSGVVASPAQRVDVRGVMPAVGAVLLGPAATQDGVYTLIYQRYQKNRDNKLSADCFPLFPQLFAALDKDGDSEITKFEILGL